MIADFALLNPGYLLVAVLNAPHLPGAVHWPKLRPQRKHSVR
jgi:hypothetical protein